MIRGEVTPRRRLSSEESRIPVPSSPILRRSGSQRLSTFSPIAEHARNGNTNNRTPPLNRHRSLQSLNTPLSACLSPDRDDDLDSVQSFGSAASVASSASQCDHVSFARNGTTFSSRQKRFIFHCSPHTETGSEYLTPTQRANRTIRQLKQLLHDKQTELIDKEREIFRLTKEVVELRLLKAGSVSFSKIDLAKDSHDVDSDSSFQPHQEGISKSIFDDVSTPVSKKEVVNGNDRRDSPSSTDGVAPLPAPLADVPASLVDSGHFEDLNSTRDWSQSPHSSPSVSLPAAAAALSAPSTALNQASLVERLKHHHQDEMRELKERHNDKVDSLLQRITEANERFCQLRPKLEEAENRIKELVAENEELKRSQKEAEENHKAIYLEMYKKGQEAATLETDARLGNGEAGNNSHLSEREKLLNELNLTRRDLENVKANYRRLLETRQSVSQQDPEITLNFLKSAVYYFLTDRENSHRHLSAIESILGFTDNEKMNIEKAYLWR